MYYDDKRITPPADGHTEMVYYPVPRPETEASVPAALAYIILTKGVGGEGDCLYFYILRDLNTPLTSFTLSYRFSPLPIMLEDPDAPMYTFDYTDAELNVHEYIVCKMNLTPGFVFDGCSAYVSSAVGEDGTLFSHAPGDFAYGDEDMARINATLARTRQKAQTPPPAARFRSASRYTPPDDSWKKKKTRRFVKATGICLCLIGAAVLFFIGGSYIGYQRTMLSAEILISAGEYTEAERLCDTELSDNRFYASRKSGMTATVSSLLAEGRYNEAFKIVSESPFASLLQTVCESGAENALSEEDYLTAYAYAAAAPEPFGGEVSAKAAEALYDINSDTFREDAYAVAYMTEDSRVRDTLLSALMDYAVMEHKYVVAMRAARGLSEEAARDAATADIFSTATRYYITVGEYFRAAEYIRVYRDLLPEGKNEIDEDIADILIEYFYNSDTKDVRSTFFLAKQFGMDASDVTVAPEDIVIREDLSGIYPLLTPAQKRVYHARTLAVGSIVLSCADGVVDGGGNGFLTALEGKPPVASVFAGTRYAVLLHTDGTVTLLPICVSGNSAVSPTEEDQQLMASAAFLKNVVSASVGKDHIVFLHEGGTATALGNKDGGACDVSDWTDLAAVTAGDYFTVGLRTDGTLVACGSDGAGQCRVDGYHNVVDIRAAAQSLFILFSDGTTALVGERSMGLAMADGLENVRRIRAGGVTVVAEFTDGSCMTYGHSTDGGRFPATLAQKHPKDFDVGDGILAASDGKGRVRPIYME